MKDINLPQELQSQISSESTDFIVKSKRELPISEIIKSILFSMIFVIVGCSFLFISQKMFFSQINSKSTNEATLDKSITYKMLNHNESGVNANFNTIFNTMLALFSLIFTIIGFSMLIPSIKLIFKEGAYFVGTPHRLIKFQNKKIKFTSWENFSENIEITNSSIKFELKTGGYTYLQGDHKRSEPIFIPDVIYIIGIQNINEIEQIVTKRIRENNSR